MGVSLPGRKLEVPVILSSSRFSFSFGVTWLPSGMVKFHFQMPSRAVALGGSAASTFDGKATVMSTAAYAMARWNWSFIRMSLLISGGRFLAIPPRTGLSFVRRGLAGGHAEFERNLFLIRVITPAVYNLDRIALVCDRQQAEAAFALSVPHAINALTVRSAFDGRILVQRRCRHHRNGRASARGVVG